MAVVEDGPRSPAPEGWAEHIDDATQHPYYHHEALNVTQWEFPSSDQAYEEEDVSRAVEAPEDDNIESWEVARSPADAPKSKAAQAEQGLHRVGRQPQIREAISGPQIVAVRDVPSWNPCHDVLFPASTNVCADRVCRRGWYW